MQLRRFKEAITARSTPMISFPYTPTAAISVTSGDAGNVEVRLGEARAAVLTDSLQPNFTALPKAIVDADKSVLDPEASECVPATVCVCVCLRSPPGRTLTIYDAAVYNPETFEMALTVRSERQSASIPPSLKLASCFKLGNTKLSWQPERNKSTSALISIY